MVLSYKHQGENFAELCGGENSKLWGCRKGRGPRSWPSPAPDFMEPWPSPLAAQLENGAKVPLLLVRDRKSQVRHQPEGTMDRRPYAWHDGNIPVLAPANETWPTPLLPGLEQRSVQVGFAQGSIKVLAKLE